MTSGILHSIRLAWIPAVILSLLSVLPAEAYTRWSGLYFMENSYAANQDNSSNLLQSGINLSIRPPTKKKLDARLNIRLDYTNADGESLWNLSPVGNLGVDLAGESFTLNLQHIRTAIITTDAELLENKTYRVSLGLYPKHRPRLNLSYSRLEQAIDGEDFSSSDLYSLYSDYDFRKWLNLRTGYDLQKRNTGVVKTVISDSLLFGAGINREILTRTKLTGDASYVRNTTKPDIGFRTSSNNYALRLGVDSRPSQWLGLGAHYSLDLTESESSKLQKFSTKSTYSDLTASLHPYYGVRFWNTVGNRTFDGETDDRSIDYFTLGGSLNRDISEKVSMTLTGTRTFESDPDMGDNTRDSLALNSLMDLTTRASLRFNLNVTRNEFPAFVNTQAYDASGPLTTRDLYDDRPVGFTFFDTDNNDLYTKNSIFFADWSAPVRVDPPSEEKFYVNKSVQANLQATEKMSITLYYSINSSSDQLELLAVERKNFNGTMVYQPNRRTTYSLTGNYSGSEEGAANYSGTVNFNYRFLRRHQMNLSYGRRNSNGYESDNFSGNLRLILPKRSNLELTYAGSRLFEDEQTDFIRVRFTHIF